MIQALDFCLEQLKVISDDLAEYAAFLVVGADEILGDLLDIFDGVAGVHLLVLVVVLDAALRLADRARTRACYAAAHHDGLEGVQATEGVLLALHL